LQQKRRRISPPANMIGPCAGQGIGLPGIRVQDVRCFSNVSVKEGHAMELADINQWGIIVLSCTSIWLVGRREHWRRWGFVVGLMGQPFWFWSSWQHEQWGIFAVSVWYTYAWLQGIWNFWIKPAEG